MGTGSFRGDGVQEPPVIGITMVKRAMGQKPATG